MTKQGKGILYISATVVGLLIILAAVLWYLVMPRQQEPSYRFVMSWGMKGADPGYLDGPTGIAVYDSEVFVADSENQRIQVYNRMGEYKRIIGNSNGKALKLGRPMNIAVKNERLYVPDFTNSGIHIFNLNGSHLNSFKVASKTEAPFYPSGVDANQIGEIFVTNFTGKEIYKYSADGSFQKRVGGSLSEKTAFSNPTDITIDHSDYIYLTEGSGNRIQVFDSKGRQIHKWGGMFGGGEKGSLKGWFKLPSSIAVGPDGNIFVTDFQNHRVQKFSPSGEFLTSFGNKTKGRERLNYPIGVDVDGDGTVFVSDYGKNRITKWRPGFSKSRSDIAS